MKASDSNTELSDVDNWYLTNFNADEIRYSVVGCCTNAKRLLKDNLTAKDWNRKQAAFRAKLKNAAKFLLKDFKLDFRLW